MATQPSLPDNFIPTLLASLNENQILTEATDRHAYGYDNSRKHVLPDLVVFPQSHEDVVAIVKTCNQFQVPLTARGRGTGTTGATVPLQGGVILSTERMQAIVEYSPDDRYIVVQPGLTNQAVQDHVAEQGFFWPPDPSSAAYCSIGGNLAYNSAGPRAVKYGTPRENVLGLRVVTGNGDSFHTGVYTTKGVVGFDLTRLMIGSEGSLGVITEATLKLTPLAENIRTLQAIYSDIESATTAVAQIMAQPVIPCALEFIDGAAINMIRDYSEMNFPENAGAMLMIEVDGSESSLDHAVEAISKAASTTGLVSLTAAKDKNEARVLWDTRKALSPALRTIAPKKINEDVVVPVSQIPALIRGLESISNKFSIPIVNFGHAGNGNIHVNLLLDPDDPVQSQNAHECLSQVFKLVLDLKGTLSGEHGVGIEKRDFVDWELDSVSLELMKKIKQQFDPNGILNPDKIFPLKLND
ncbi:MAG: FAD-binding protein [Gammaproteobacteria bacterium]|nr:FAD-binding protein [Gammaproteobacteria bacterium]